jgi:flagellar biogenesis protein FliO
MKNKQFLFVIIFLILFSFVKKTFSEDVNFEKGKDFVSISFKNAPPVYKVDFYNYGMNVVAKGLNIRQMRIFKFQQDVVVRTIPLDKEKALVKIQYPIKNLEKHIKIYDKDKFIIKIYQNPLTVANANAEKSIVDEAKKLSLINTSPVAPATQRHSVATTTVAPVKKFKEPGSTEKTVSNNQKTDNLFSLENNSGFSKNIVKTYSILFALCVTIIIGAFLFRKFYGKLSPSINRGVIKVLYKKDISPKKSIAITKILNEYYILGITSHSISYIDKILSDTVLEELQLIEGEKEKDKFIKYLKNEEKKEEKTKEQNTDKDKMIKMIQVKLKEYKNNFNNVS